MVDLTEVSQLAGGATEAVFSGGGSGDATFANKQINIRSRTAQGIRVSVPILTLVVGFEDGRIFSVKFVATGSVPVHSSAIFPFMSQDITPSQPPSQLNVRRDSNTQQNVRHDSTPSPQHIDDSTTPSSADQHIEHVLDAITTPSPQRIDDSTTPSSAVQHVEHVLDATTEMNTVNDGSTALQEAVQDNVVTDIDSNPCEVTEIVHSAQDGDQHQVEAAMDKQTVSSSNNPFPNTHSMVTRSKVGTFKPKLYTLQCQ
ncbi:hypothetical protein V6N12_007982 [Hibiscus sabdariffa]